MFPNFTASTMYGVNRMTPIASPALSKCSLQVPVERRVVARRVAAIHAAHARSTQQIPATRKGK